MYKYRNNTFDVDNNKFSNDLNLLFKNDDNNISYECVEN